MNDSYLPKMAGNVTVHFHDGLDLPMRSGTPTSRGVLRFPYRSGMTVDRLKGGKQLLVQYPGDFKPFASDAAGLSFFAGEDEQAFITAVAPEAVRAFKFGGEDAFFDILKPGAIKEAESVLSTTAGRQGDIWYILLPLSWDDLIGSVRKKRVKSKLLNGAEARMVRILGTRHLLSGQYVPKTNFEFNGRAFNNAVGQGILSAPDHTTRNLEDGPHMLVRTKHIAQVVPRDLKKLGWD